MNNFESKRPPLDIYSIRKSWQVFMRLFAVRPFGHSWPKRDFVGIQLFSYLMVTSSRSGLWVHGNARPEGRWGQKAACHRKSWRRPDVQRRVDAAFWRFACIGSRIFPESFLNPSRSIVAGLKGDLKKAKIAVRQPFPNPSRTSSQEPTSPSAYVWSTSQLSISLHNNRAHVPH